LETFRAFVALELPHGARLHVERVLQTLHDAVPPNSLSLEKPENVHLTLQFLGPLPLVREPDVADAIKRAVGNHAAMPLRCTGLQTFAERHTIRVVWLGVDGAGLTTLHTIQQALGALLLPLGFTPDKRAFTPHITLARARRDAGSNVLRQVQQVLEKLAPEPVEFMGKTISLMESTSGPAGTMYRSRMHVECG